MKRGILILVLACLFATIVLAQPPAGYYLTAEGKTGLELKQALHNIIDGHTESTYTDLWTHFRTADDKSDGYVWDMYSDKPGLTPPYVYIFGDNQCGNYTKEGDCYNREHSFPKSWFGGEILPMYTDLFHVYPTDGWVNNKRGNYPFGEVSSATWTSLNGSKLGANTWPGYSGTVFEPIDAYKGDFARSMFYMAARYYSEDASWPGSEMVTGAEPKSWAVAMLLNWHNADPVSPKETERNDAVYTIQGNRNPFIDKPEYATYIWGDPSAADETIYGRSRPVVYPVPARDRISISFPGEFSGGVKIRLTTLAGRVVTIIEDGGSGGDLTVDLSLLEGGLYLLIIECNSLRYGYLIPVIR
ncbi:MAG: endonuclease [Bacteroidales bacterium]|nr:endonuclease [Bacteroidales bacterium]